MFESMTIPASVRPGGHVRILSPGMPTLNYIPVRAARAERVLFDLGLLTSYGRRSRLVSSDGTVAGTAAERAADLMDAFADPDVDAIIAADAGLGGRDLLDHLDAGVIAANPKPFIGYCDNVFVHYFLATQAGISSLYGCTFMIHLGEAGGVHPETVDYLTWALDTDRPIVCTPVASRTGALISWYVPELEQVPRQRDIPGGWTWLRSGTSRGPLIGGELTLLPELIDSFDLRLTSAVLFWDIGYHGLAVRPLFRRLAELVDLTRLSGMIVGAHPTKDPRTWADCVEGLLREFLPDSDFPVVVNADLSHTCPAWTVPFAEEVILQAPYRILFPRRPAGLSSRPGTH